VEDASKYSQRPKLDGNKTEIYRVYYDRNGISFELFLWMEEDAIRDLIDKKLQIFKAYPLEGFEYPITICKN
jgi:hypothetical protein